jgi:hypothetical protein
MHPVAMFLVTTYFSLLLGHSVGMHRRFILRIHDERDWAQRQTACHDFFAHRRSPLVDLFWQLNCRFRFARNSRRARLFCDRWLELADLGSTGAYLCQRDRPLEHHVLVPQSGAGPVACQERSGAGVESAGSRAADLRRVLAQQSSRVPRVCPHRAARRSRTGRTRSGESRRCQRQSRCPAAVCAEQSNIE